MHYPLGASQHPALPSRAAPGMGHDRKLSYANRRGFRCGACFEYPAFAPVAGQILAIRVSPSVVMECSVMGTCYFCLGINEADDAKFAELKAACQTVNGSFSTLWHNPRLIATEEKRKYAHFL